MLVVLADNSALGGGIALGVILLVAAGCVFAYRKEESRKRALEEERLADRARHERAGAAGVERDSLMFDQHRKINDLHIRKLEAEVSLLQAQVGSRADDADRMHAAKEFHELTVEKTKLEIDSLRLHIAEQRKRLDEFGLGGG